MRSSKATMVESDGEDVKNDIGCTSRQHVQSTPLKVEYISFPPADICLFANVRLPEPWPKLFSILQSCSCVGTARRWLDTYPDNLDWRGLFTNLSHTDILSLDETRLSYSVTLLQMYSLRVQRQLLELLLSCTYTLPLEPLLQFVHIQQTHTSDEWCSYLFSTIGSRAEQLDKNDVDLHDHGDDMRQPTSPNHNRSQTLSSPVIPECLSTSATSQSASSVVKETIVECITELCGVLHPTMLGVHVGTALSQRQATSEILHRSLYYFSTCTTDELLTALTTLSIHTAPDSVFCDYFLRLFGYAGDNVSSINTAIDEQPVLSLGFRKSVILLTKVIWEKLKLCTNKSPPSRRFMTILQTIAKENSHIFTDGVVLPMLKRDEDEDRVTINHASEITQRRKLVVKIVVENSDTDTRGTCLILVQEAITRYIPDHSTVIRTDKEVNSKLLEGLCECLQLLLESRVTLTSNIIELFLSHCTAIGGLIPKSLKFGAMMFAAINTYQAQFRPYVRSIEAILDKHKTFMAKKIQTCLKKW
eukprot:CFRG0671T1